MKECVAIMERIPFARILMKVFPGGGSMGMPRCTGPSELCRNRTFDWKEDIFASAKRRLFSLAFRLLIECFIFSIGGVEDET
jgi:hypothetical protein